MKKNPNENYSKLENDDDYDGIDFCDNVMEDPNIISLLENRNNKVVLEITQNLKLPINITTIKIAIVPSGNTQNLYSFDGLELIINNLFKEIKKTFQDDLKKGNVYLKTFYKKDDFYTIPKICVELIFFRKLHKKTIEFLKKKLNNEQLMFRNIETVIQQEVILSNSILKDFLKIPLLIGQPQFKHDGVLTNFTIRQLIEMNYIHGISLIKLNMEYMLQQLNKGFSIFLYGDIKMNILESPNEDFYTAEVDDFVNDIFGTFE
jgi:hypothetical protein